MSTECWPCSDTANDHGICRKNAPSKARGKWRCLWNLPPLEINKQFKQRAVTALTPGRIPLHMQKRYANA